MKGKELEHSVRARNEMTKRLNKRRTAESSLHNIALQMNGRALTKLHDAGMNPSPHHKLLTVLSAHKMVCLTGTCALSEHGQS